MKPEELNRIKPHYFDELKRAHILKEKRMKLRLTQQTVADRAGIKLQQYQKFESGTRNIMTSSFVIACRVIEALGMNISDFYHDKYTLDENCYAEDELSANR